MYRTNEEMLLDAVFLRAIEDIITAWRFYERHGKTKREDESKYITSKRKVVKQWYNSSVSFLKSSSKGRKILKVLMEVDEDGYKKLLKSGVCVKHSGGKKQGETQVCS